jgi:hypothetical protein
MGGSVCRKGDEEQKENGAAILGNRASLIKSGITGNDFR